MDEEKWKKVAIKTKIGDKLSSLNLEWNKKQQFRVLNYFDFCLFVVVILVRRK